MYMIMPGTNMYVYFQSYFCLKQPQLTPHVSKFPRMERINVNNYTKISSNSLEIIF